MPPALHCLFCSKLCLKAKLIRVLHFNFSQVSVLFWEEMLPLTEIKLGKRSKLCFINMLGYQMSKQMCVCQHNHIFISLLSASEHPLKSTISVYEPYIFFSLSVWVSLTFSSQFRTYFIICCKCLTRWKKAPYGKLWEQAIHYFKSKNNWNECLFKMITLLTHNHISCHGSCYKQNAASENGEI